MLWLTVAWDITVLRPSLSRLEVTRNKHNHNRIKQGSPNFFPMRKFDYILHLIKFSRHLQFLECYTLPSLSFTHPTTRVRESCSLPTIQNWDTSWGGHLPLWTLRNWDYHLRNHQCWWPVVLGITLQILSRLVMNKKSRIWQSACRNSSSLCPTPHQQSSWHELSSYICAVSSPR